MNRYLIAATLLALIAAFIFAFKSEPLNNGETQISGRDRQNQSLADRETESLETAPIQTKKSVRYPKPTIEETIHLVKNTIIPRADFKNLPFLEAVAALTTLIQEAGIPAHELRIVFNKSASWPNQWIVQEVPGENAPLAVVLKYMCGSTVIRPSIEPGVIRFLHQTESSPYIRPEIPEIEEPNTQENRYDPNDPFGIPPSRENDPFAPIPPQP